ncbi:hypothetical protein ACWNT8_07585 [Pigmentibacter ruber]|uniref:hypothetical protein n=1 Tax=Pigmentibacter ruber TaxID=2683196 RepID=UPI00131CE764|nr:hypothetical protein [Pigmentibacter ruber]
MSLITIFTCSSANAAGDLQTLNCIVFLRFGYACGFIIKEDKSTPQITVNTASLLIPTSRRLQKILLLKLA